MDVRLVVGSAHTVNFVKARARLLLAGIPQDVDE